jgi:hypothetical protein
MPTVPFSTTHSRPWATRGSGSTDSVAGVPDSLASAALGPPPIARGSCASRAPHLARTSLVTQRLTAKACSHQPIAAPNDIPGPDRPPTPGSKVILS